MTPCCRLLKVFVAAVKDWTACSSWDPRSGGLDYLLVCLSLSLCLIFSSCLFTFTLSTRSCCSFFFPSILEDGAKIGIVTVNETKLIYCIYCFFLPTPMILFFLFIYASRVMPGSRYGYEIPPVDYWSFLLIS